MLNHLTTAALLLTCLTAGAITIPPWADANVNEIDRLPAHTSFFAFPAGEETKDKAEASNYLDLSGTWLFRGTVDRDKAPDDAFYMPGYQPDGWATMPVPGNWELNGFGDPIYINGGYPWRDHFTNNPPLTPDEQNHTGDYLMTVDIPADWDGRQVVAHFGSVTSNLQLWVNGHAAGYGEDSKLAQEFDITPYIKPGEKNTIALRVNRWCDGTYFEDQDFFRLSGLVRENYLYSRPVNGIDDIRIDANLADNYTDGVLNIAIDLRGRGPVSVVLSEGGKVIASKALKKASGTVEMTLDVPAVRRWTAETPELYDLTVSFGKGKDAQTVPLKTGFRRVEIKDRQLCINGKPVIIKGVNRHELDPETGYNISLEQMERDIRVLKQLNMNAVRTCHYPDDPRWYDLCDRYGIYLVAEANIESHGMGDRSSKASPSRFEEFAKTHVERNLRNVATNRNHPSVIIWSLGNEAGAGENFVKAYHAVKAVDKTRPVQYEQFGDSSATDIYAPMYASYESCRRYLAKGSDADKPLIQCEYAHAMGNSMGGFKEYWDMIRSEPLYQGGFIWDFADQSINAVDSLGRTFRGYAGDWNSYDSPGDQNFCNNGVVAPDRSFNPHAYEVQRVQQNIHGRLGGTGVMLTSEYVFRPVNDLTLRWELLHNGKTVRSGKVGDINIKAGETVEVPVNYGGIGSQGEWLLNIACLTGIDEDFIPAGSVIAREQFVLRPYDFGATVSTHPGKAGKITEDAKTLTVDGGNYRVSFDKATGALVSFIDANANEILAPGHGITPNFWRAPTDNDMGASSQIKNRLWRNPQMTLTAFNRRTRDNIIEVSADYSLDSLDATVSMLYAISPQGAVTVTETLNMPDSIGPDATRPYRIGVRMGINPAFDTVEYYGRGPEENYIDRRTAADLGHYTRAVKDMAYPYIRPQATGTRTDLRSWTLRNDAGKGVRVTAPTPFEASANAFWQEQLDDGDHKHNSHFEFLTPADATELCIDRVQQGLGCIDSWHSLPLPQYMLPVADSSFTFTLQPLTPEAVNQ